MIEEENKIEEENRQEEENKSEKEDKKNKRPDLSKLETGPGWDCSVDTGSC